MIATAPLVFDVAQYHLRGHAVPMLLTALTLLVVVVYMGLRAGWTPLTRAAAQIALLMAVWLGSMGLAFCATDARVAMWWSRAAYLGVPFLPAAFVAAATTNIGVRDRYSHLVGCCWAVSFAFCVIALETNLLMSPGHRYWWGYYPRLGVLGVPFLAYFAFAETLAVALYVRAWRNAEPGSVQARRVRGILTAVIVANLGAIDFAGNFGFVVYPAGWIFVLGFVLVVVHTVLRYEMPDVTAASTAELIVGTMGDAMLVVDHEQIIRLVNPAACEVFGRDAAALVGLPLTRLACDVHASVHTVEMAGGVTEREIVLPGIGGGAPRTFSLSTSAMRRHDTVVATVCLLRDITAFKQIQHELEQARDDAEAAARAKAEFLANVSHEVRTPINIVFGMTEMLLDGPLDPTQRDCLTTLRRNADSLLAIINDILDVSKLEAQKLSLEARRFRLRDVTDDAVGSLGVRAREKGLRLHCDVDAALPSHVVGDPTRLRQILVNLVGNAVKFTAMGSVTVRVEPDGPGAVRFVVRDTGIGIPADKQAAIFEAFIQADASTTRCYGGTGLGLTICRQLVGLMGGRMGLVSAPGQGATFTVSLPLAAADEPGACAA